MKKIKILLLAAVFLFSVCPLFAEYVFLKNGEIIEGEVVTDTDEKITVKEGRTNRDIPRDEILRILYSDDFKQKRYIYTTDDREIAGYIVAEDRRTYTIRKNLSSSTETTLEKSEVDGIMSRSIRGIKVSDEPRIDTEKPQSGTSISLGLYYKGILDAEIEGDDYSQSSAGLVGDIDPATVPVILRGAFLYEMGAPEATKELSKTYDEDRFGLEFLGTICFVFYKTDNLRLWAGPQLGYMYVEEEYTSDFEESYFEFDYHVLFYGAAAGVDFFLTDSIYLTAEFGYRLLSGNIQREIYDVGGAEPMTEPEKFDEDLSGNSPYLGFGVMYQF